MVAFPWRVRALKAQRAGWEPPVVPVELRPLPVTMQAGRGDGKPHEGGGSSLRGGAPYFYYGYLIAGLNAVLIPDILGNSELPGIGVPSLK